MGARHGAVLDRLHGDGELPWGTDPARFDPAAVTATLDSMRWLYDGYFRVSAQGWENLPERNAMLVMNHSGGTSIPDVWGLAFAWYDHLGLERPLRALAHDMVFSTPLTGPLFERLGVLRASRERAQVTLGDLRHDVLVCPGGDQETWRPWTERYRVNFGGRRGYVRSALAAGVPIVPVSHAGAHDTLLVLSRGARIATLLRLPELARARVFPLHLSLPWGLGVGPLPHWPLPGSLRYHIGEPVSLPVGWVPGRTPSEELVLEMDAEVQRRVQAGLDALRAERSPRRAMIGDALERVLG